MHISTVDISQTVTDRADIAIANTYSRMWHFDLAYLTLSYSNGKVQDRIHFDGEFFCHFVTSLLDYIVHSLNCEYLK